MQLSRQGTPLGSLLPRQSDPIKPAGHPRLVVNYQNSSAGQGLRAEMAQSSDHEGERWNRSRRANKRFGHNILSRSTPIPREPRSGNVMMRNNMRVGRNCRQESCLKPAAPLKQEGDRHVIARVISRNARTVLGLPFPFTPIKAHSRLPLRRFQFSPVPAQSSGAVVRRRRRYHRPFPGAAWR
jgi:hypothetical protein